MTSMIPTRSGAPRALRTLALTLAAAALTGLPAGAQQRQGPPEVGPEHGTLMVVGGNMHDPALYKRFIELAGGPDAPIVMIPNAGGGDHYDQFYSGLDAWRAAGARNLIVLFTTDRKVADSDAFVEPLKTAQGVFFFGGRQWHIVDDYAGTKTETEIRNVLERGGVIGGSSAGASIQGSFLMRGDTKSNEVLMGDHQVGFGYLRGVAIDQHVLRRNRQFDMVKVVEAHPDLLGIGLDENTAIEVHGDMATVMGESYMLVYDNQKTTGGDGKFYFLAPGDRFNLATREAVRPAQSFRPVDGPEKKPWGGGR